MRADCNLKIETEKMMNLYGVYRDIMKQIPFRLISQVKNILERKVNDLLAVVTNFSVKFDISDSNIDIYLDRPVYEGRPILINNSSGFERFISSLAIRIALMEISQLPSPNFMAIDEGWSCFDNENINNIDVILDHLGQKFEFILTISHLQIIRQHCDIQVALRKDDAGFSYVTF
jgi:DNA repair exonuclease SbcCD ATPase subunit